MDVDPQLGEVMCHICHRVQNEDKTTELIVCSGSDLTFFSPFLFRPILSGFHRGKMLYLFFNNV